MAYDCDRNFEPCLKQGKKAHWTLINGFMAPIQVEKQENENKFEELGINNNDLINKIQNWESIYTINLHGKSKFYGVWNLSQLLQSNFQLKLIEDKRNNEDFVLPQNNQSLEETLAFQALIIY